MARKDKSLQLRIVDDSNPEPKTVVRLENREVENRADEPELVLLGSSGDLLHGPQRLDLPSRDEVELRTHQPGVDVLIDAETASLNLLEEDWGEATIRRHPIPWGWFALIGLVIAGAALWSLKYLGKADSQAIQIRSEAESVLVNEAQKELEATELIDRLDATIRNFISATSVGSLEHLVRQPARVVPLMRRYYADKPVDHGRVMRIKTLRAVTLDNHADFWMATLALGDGRSQSMILEVGETGEPLLDWETYVCYQPMPWDEFARQRPVGSPQDFRVYVEKDNFYSHEFSNADQWVCFRLTALKGENTLFGYAPAGSDEAKEIIRQIDVGGGGKISLILRLSIPEGLESRSGVVIEKLLSNRWIYLEPPDSGS